MSRLSLTFLSIIATIFLVSCERPFVEEIAPEITVVDPNIDELQTGRAILISVEVNTQFRDISTVSLNGVEMNYIQQTNRWRGNLDLVDGPNDFEVVATDVSGLMGRKSGSFLHYRPQISAGADLPVPRGGHTLTQNPASSENSFLLIGGAQTTTRDAVSDIIEITVTEDQVTYAISENGLNDPRAGHTATRMTDGKTLIIGGSIRAEARTLADLVNTVEIYDGETNEVRRVPFAGQPIRRTRHSAIRVISSSNREFIYLLGGQGDIRYGVDPRLGIRDDMRQFEYRNDSLVAIPPEPIGTRFVEALAGHSMIPLNLGNGSGIGKYIVSATEFDSSDNFSEVHSEIEVNQNSLRRIAVNSSFRVPRTEHAAARFFDGNIGFFGGRGFAQNTALKSAEIYSARTLQYYLVPSFPQLRKERWDLTATNLVDSRILLTGGFDNSGIAVRDVDFFSIL